MTFEPNKYNATPGCGNDTEATYCTHFDGKEKDFHPKYGHEISNGASYEALYGRNSVSNFHRFSKVLGKLGRWKLRGKIGLRFSQIK